MYFDYGEKEIEYLKAKDKKLAAAIERIGHINREVDNDLFSSVIHHIIGQQISTAAQVTVWKRLSEKMETINEDNVLALDKDELQSVGITYR